MVESRQHVSMTHKAAAAVTSTDASVPTALWTATTEAKGKETYDVQATCLQKRPV